MADNLYFENIIFVRKLIAVFFLFYDIIFEMDFTKFKQSSDEFGTYYSCRNSGDNLRYAL